MQRLKYHSFKNERTTKYQINTSGVIELKHLFEGLVVSSVVITILPKTNTKVEVVYLDNDNNEIGYEQHQLQANEKGYLVINNRNVRIRITGKCVALVNWFEI